MVEAGEAAGILDDVLDRLATQIEKEANLKRRVKGAMVYPIMVISFAFLVLIAMLLFIVPIFQKLYVQFNGQLPKLTQFMISASDAAPAPLVHHLPGHRPHHLPLPPLEEDRGESKQWDRFRLKVPMKIGDIVLKVRWRASPGLSSTPGRRRRRHHEGARDHRGQRRETGSSRTRSATCANRYTPACRSPQPLIEHPVFPPMVGQMVKIGEETGELDAMLGKIADFYEEEVDATITALTSIIEPIMIILVGCMVATIILSMYLPMFKLLTLIK